MLKAIRKLDGNPETERKWISGWIEQGFSALESLIAQHGDGFAFGDAPSLADCYFVPQIYSARRFGVDLKAYPRILSVEERVNGLAEFAAVHPDQQHDADRA